MSTIPAPRAARALLLALLLAVPASARPRVHGLASAGQTASPRPLLPLPGDLVPEGIARLEVAVAPGASDIHVVIAPWSFETEGWRSLPTGPGWTVVPYGQAPVALGPLHLADRSETRLWWAVVWRDATGAFRSCETREFTIVQRFANRAAPRVSLAPSATGLLPERPAAALAPGPGRRPIALASGYVLAPGGSEPEIPSALKRHRGALVAGEASGREPYVVQFGDDSPDSARARIARAAGAIAWPLAGEGWLVRMDAAAVARLRAGTGAAWVAP